MPLILLLSFFPFSLSIMPLILLICGSSLFLFRFSLFMDQHQLPQFSELVQHCRFQLQVPITSGDPVDPFGGIESLKGALDEGFSVQYLANEGCCFKCMESGGAYGMKDDGSQFLCYCPDGPYDLACPTSTYHVGVI
ncbi:hypothetical protein QN277_015906 [Acacia crassicarpa]|uniref:Wall-associated receptor kinase C-terminal domain-containing protein n=1 Tax=Acacia crassicarpa TaxID=499986 RepID=A0AAE1KMK8_9FABA|nr:hypothetical protein QN277_015906 [Acacia crassicarpa]